MSRKGYTPTEKQFMDALIETAQRLHYQVAHIPDRLYGLAASQGRYDALAGATGLPDLLICGYGALLIVECKAANGKTRPEQDAWIEELSSVVGDKVHVFVARPEDQNRIMDLMVRYREESWRKAS